MQGNTVACYRSRLKTKGYTNIHITLLSRVTGQYFVECQFDDKYVSAVVDLVQMSSGLCFVPLNENK